MNSKFKVIPLLFVILFAAVETKAMRWYSASTGKWLSRDPYGENGCENLYVFVFNNAIDDTDPLGLAGLKYASEGRYYFNGDFRYSFHVGDESGNQKSSNASFWQYAEVTAGNTGGICNSTVDVAGGSGNSSFVHAIVKNSSKCRLAVSCTCTVSFAVANWAPRKSLGVLVMGDVLGRPFSHTYLEKRNSGHSGSYAFLTEGVGVEQTSLGFFLYPGESHELYNAYDQTASPPLLGAGFSESMQGTCSCSTQ